MWTPPKLQDYSEATLNQAFQRIEMELFDFPAYDYSAEEFRVEWLGRKSGRLAKVRDEWLSKAPAEQKKELGKRFNALKSKVEQFIAAQTALDMGVSGLTVDETAFAVASDALRKNIEQKLVSERLDITLPGIQRPIGVRHPVLRVMDEIVAVFKAMGYSVGEGPEVETDYYNFEALNFPPNHPARDTQDTLFVAGQENKPARERLLLRTHTSPVQIRTMELQPPPVRIVIPGKVHRNDPLDATHSPVFHQVEGLAVDTNITFCDLKGTLDHAMKALFGSSVKTRFYPSFFPFTEPSADMQVSCIFCGGKGCRKCKFSGWIELLGCGMVDPNVFEFVKQYGYDSSKISGFAFGMGVDRLALLKYEVEGIQMFFEGDVRFLEQFA